MAKKQVPISTEFMKGLWDQNPVLKALLGLCPTLAVTTSAIISGLGLLGLYGVALARAKGARWVIGRRWIALPGPTMGRPRHAHASRPALRPPRSHWGVRCG